MDEDPPHSAQVARLALELFDATARRATGSATTPREILEAAALLCNVGMFLSHAQHHKHSYYVIRGTDRLTGFNDDEVERIALVARYHRKSEPKPEAPRVRGARRRRQARGVRAGRPAAGRHRPRPQPRRPGQSVSVEDDGDGSS